MFVGVPSADQYEINLDICVTMKTTLQCFILKLSIVGEKGFFVINYKLGYLSKLVWNKNIYFNSHFYLTKIENKTLLSFYYGYNYVILTNFRGNTGNCGSFLNEVNQIVNIMYARGDLTRSIGLYRIR